MGMSAANILRLEAAREKTLEIARDRVVPAPLVSDGTGRRLGTGGEFDPAAGTLRGIDIRTLLGPEAETGLILPILDDEILWDEQPTDYVPLIQKFQSSVEFR